MINLKRESDVKNVFIKEKITHWPTIKKVMIKNLLEHESGNEGSIIEFMQIVDEFYYKNIVVQNQFESFLDLYPVIRKELKQLKENENNENEDKLKEFIEKIDSFWRDYYI